MSSWQKRLNDLAGTEGRGVGETLSSLSGLSGRGPLAALNELAGTDGLGWGGAANAWAGTSGLSVGDALSQASTSSAFDASAYEGLTAWWQPSRVDGSGTLSDGAAVAAWSDVSGNGRTQTVSGTATFEVDHFGSGAHAVRFASGGSATTASFATSQNFTVYAVSERAVASNIQAILNGDSAMGDSKRWFQCAFVNADYWGVGFATGDTPFIASAAAMSPTTPAVWAMTRTNTLITLYRNGVSVGSAAASGTPASPTRGVLMNGGTGFTSHECWYGDVALYSTAHSGGTVTEVCETLMAQYGIGA